MLELARSQGLGLPGTGQLGSLVQINEEEPYTFQNFLSKFETLRMFYRSPEIIGRITREAIADAAIDNVRYMELRFTPVALSKAEGFPLSEVIDWVIEGVAQGKKEYDIDVRLIVSVNRHESPQLAEQVVGLALDRGAAGIVGIDLAGNEAQFPAMPFSSIFKDARKDGLHVTIHGGEWGRAENIEEAILHLGAERIGHGIRVVDNPHIVDVARDCNMVFEVCVTSNYQSGVVPALGAHPLPRMLSAGLNVTINTDDPSISRINLSHEYRLVCEDLGIPLDVLQERVLAAARAAFLPAHERRLLVQRLTKELASSELSQK